MNSELIKWLESGKHLPLVLRDFHDQKKVFKEIHSLYRDANNADAMPTWTDAHVYVVDWFLWYMASRGYSLQRNRTKQNFSSLP